MKLERKLGMLDNVLTYLTRNPKFYDEVYRNKVTMLSELILMYSDSYHAGNIGEHFYPLIEKLEMGIIELIIKGLAEENCVSPAEGLA